MIDHQRRAVRSALWRDPSFCWLTSSGAIALFGAQFTLLALPWLVLRLTADSLMLGLILMTVNVPRALLILIGGALTDRYSARRVLILTKHVNFVLHGALGLLVVGGHPALWAVFALALAIGIASAFSIPSSSSILPEVVAPEQLETANAILLGLRQAALLGGPLLAALVIFIFGHGDAGSLGEIRGLGAAFLVDAAGFGASAWMLTKVRSRTHRPAPEARQSVLRAVAAGVRHLWRDQSLRTLCLYFAATTCFVGGPLQVALPILAQTRLGDGVAGYGSLMAAHGAGVLAGMVVSGTLRRGRFCTLGTMILLIDGAAGALLLPLGRIDALWQGVLLLLPLGMLAGILQVTLFTWMQRRVPAAMMGRAMSHFMFIFIALAPISASITGFAMRGCSAAQIFTYSGLVLFCIVLVAVGNPRIRTIGGPQPVAQPVEG